MSLANNYDEFKREIGFIIKQNPSENELYSIVPAIIRERENAKTFFVRDVSNLNQTPNRQNQKDRMYKISEDKYGAIDFLVMKPDYEYSKRNVTSILGAIEIKALFSKLDSERNKKVQFVKGLKTFGKLLYTNGIEWRFYKYDKDSNSITLVWKEVLGEYCWDGNKNIISDKDRIIWSDISHWYSLLEKLSRTEWGN